jgi:addiction module HigA family antidote
MTIRDDNAPADDDISGKIAAHPGGFIRREIIEKLGLSVREAADALEVTRTALSTLINGHASLSPDMALRIEKAFGVSMDSLMRMQGGYDIAQARSRAHEITVKRFVPKDVTPQPRLL